MNEIQKLKELAEQASPGPWEWNNDATESDYFEQVVLRNGLRICEVNYDNAKFISKANPQTILKLIRVIAAAPKGCICHVDRCDGYFGTNHSSDCNEYRSALGALDDPNGC